MTCDLMHAPHIYTQTESIELKSHQKTQHTNTDPIYYVFNLTQKAQPTEVKEVANAIYAYLPYDKPPPARVLVILIAILHT